MSFFAKKNNASSRKFLHKKRKKKTSSIVVQEEISSSDEEIKKIVPDEMSSEDDNETVQEKKLRLCKEYLMEIEREESHNSNEELTKDVIGKRLHKDYLNQTGKLRLSVAHSYKECETEKFKILKCKEHRCAVACVSVTSDNNFLFSGSKDGSLVKWSIEEGKKVCSLPFFKKNSVCTKVKGHSKAITCIAVSTDSKFLAVADETSVIQIWNPENLEHVHTLSGHCAAVTGVTFRRDSHTLYSCGKDQCVKVWSLDQMAYVETLYGHQCPITSIDALWKERAITSGGTDATIRIWKVVEESHLVYNDQCRSTDVVRFVNKDNFISGSDDGQLCVWSVNKKKPLCTVKDAHGCDPSNGQPYAVCSLTSLVNTDLVASGSEDGYVKAWKLENMCRSIALLFNIPVIGFVNGLSFTSDGKYLIAGVGREHKFGRWNVLKSAQNCIIVMPLKRT